MSGNLLDAKILLVSVAELAALSIPGPKPWRLVFSRRIAQIVSVRILVDRF